MKKKERNPLFAEITLAEDSNKSEVQLLRTGKFTHWCEEILEITKDTLLSLKRNFDGNVKRTKLAIDYFHASHQEAAGWITEVVLKNDNTELWVNVEWTERAKEKILSKEIRYLSVDFSINYIDNETKIEYGATLNGGGLTNRPFVKGMNPVLSEYMHRFDKNGINPETINNGSTKLQTKEKENTMNMTDLKKEIVVLSEADKKEIGAMLGLEPKDVKLSEENDSLKAENKKLSEKVVAQEKEAEFTVLLSDGKAVPAQKVAYMAGNMAEFVKLAVAVNLKAEGSGNPKLEDKKLEPKTAEEAEEKVIKLSVEKLKADENLSEAQAYSQVLNENPELEKLIG